MSEEDTNRNKLSITPMKDKKVIHPHMVRALPRKSIFELVDRDEDKMKFYPGLLLMYGATNTGKSTTGFGLVFEAARQGIRSAHQVWDEVNSRTNTPLTPINKVTKGESFIPFTVTGPNQVKDGTTMVNEYMELIALEFKSSNPSLMVIDSIGPALALSSCLVDQPAGKGAMVEGYGMFLRMLNTIAVAQGCTIVGLINKSLFNVESLEGATDGVIEMTSKGAFTKRDRTDRTTSTKFTLSEDAVKLSLEWQDSTSQMSNDINTLGGMK